MRIGILLDVVCIATLGYFFPIAGAIVGATYVVLVVYTLVKHGYIIV